METISLSVKVAWWVRWYIQGVALFASLTGAEPDLDKVLAKVMRGVRVSTGCSRCGGDHPVSRCPWPKA